MRLSGFVITGTDTGVGKTFVTARLAADLRRRNIRTLACKPAESGRDNDAHVLAEAAGHAPVCLYRFAAPVAPGVAAEAEGIHIDLPSISKTLRQAFATQKADLILVEGA